MLFILTSKDLHLPRSYNDNKLVGVASFILFAVAATNIAATAIFARNLAATSTQLSSSATWIYR